MKIKTKTRTEQILTVMHILTWVAFIGSMIKAGAILISFSISYINPEAANNLYEGMNFHSLKNFSVTHYAMHVSLVVVLSIMKAYLSYLVIKALSKVNLMNPFRMEVARLIEKISYILLGICAVATLHNAYSTWLSKITDEHYGYEVSAEFLFVAGLVFIISQVFKRGVEIQSENELTV